MLTTAEISKELKVCEHTVRNWIKTGKLKAYKANNYWRVKREDLDKFLKEA